MTLKIIFDCIFFRRIRFDEIHILTFYYINSYLNIVAFIISTISLLIEVLAR